jgi:undecaprenyl diphosphate synthase
MTLTLAWYGSREELVNAVKTLVIKLKNNIISVDYWRFNYKWASYTRKKFYPIDLLIYYQWRAQEIILWQIAMRNYIFTDVLWPDFTEQNLYEAISYQKRERRFKTSEQIK